MIETFLAVTRIHPPPPRALSRFIPNNLNFKYKIVKYLPRERERQRKKNFYCQRVSCIPNLAPMSRVSGFHYCLSVVCCCHWCWGCIAITGTDPVLGEARANLNIWMFQQHHNGSTDLDIHAVWLWVCDGNCVVLVISH